jgi:trimeric autotransporter adhesin
MTVPSTTRKAGPYTGNGVQTVFPFSFKVFSVADVTVTQTDTIGVDATLTSGYVVTLNPDQVASPGGSITLSVAPPSGYKITATGALPYDQTLSLPGGGNFSPVAAENAFDRVVMQLQQVNEKVSRAITLPVSSTQAPSDYLTLVNSASASAAASASQAATSAAGAGVSATSASISASASATSAAQAVVAKDAAIAAWAASTAPSEQLASISTNIHFGAVVKSIVYDTSKDSDGGAWRKRCQGKSWANENQDEFWIGQRASAAAAWAIAGNGAYFQNTTDGKFYRLNGTSPNVIEVFRGGSTEFPAQVAIVAETARVVIYDLTQASCPMWMVFTAGNAYMARGSVLSVSAINGMMALGCGSAQSLALISFPSDSGYLVWTTSQYTGPYLGGISQRNAALGFNTYGTKYAPIVNQNVNDVAITVLDTAPIDPATGLPVPTIAVATEGGVSVIKDDGTVVSKTITGNATTAVLISYPYLQFDASGVSGHYQSTYDLRTLTTSTIASIDAADSQRLWQYTSLGGTGAGIKYWLLNGLTTHLATRTKVDSVLGSAVGFAKIFDNPKTPTSGMGINITNAYNSGWLPGDIRGAYLADTVAETITASGELVTNGTFTTDTSGWTAASAYPSTASAVAGEMQVTATATFGRQIYGFATVIGKTYKISGQGRLISGTGPVGLNVTTAAGADIVINQTASATLVPLNMDYTAIATTTYICAALTVSGAVGGFDNISVKLADPDRSVKNTGMVINGSLTKTAVATGAGLVAYSGFSASNYLEQPYSANLDFGTGDTGRLAWIKFSATAAKEVIWCRDSATTGVLSRLQVDVTTSFLSFTMFDGTTTRTATGTTAIDDGAWHLVETRYSAGTLTILVDGVIYASATGAALLTMNNATAVLRIGVDCQGANPASSGSLSLMRVSATVASNDQLAHIYRTELPLFRANAQCTVAGTSTAVTALAYDDVADTLHVGTSWGRSGFRDLLRIDSEATTTGAITSLSANEGVVITGGASSAKAYAPAMYLRDELRRKDVARKALGRIPAFFDYTATASQTAFVAPKGFTIKALYKNGTLMRETTTGVYWTRSNDGFQETATLSVGATVSDWISLMCVRS